MGLLSSLTFATYSSESDFLGLTFLLYRKVHHSLHWGPHWRNSQNISCFKESNFRKGEIYSQNQFEAQNQTKTKVNLYIVFSASYCSYLSHSSFELGSQYAVQADVNLVTLPSTSQTLGMEACTNHIHLVFLKSATTIFIKILFVHMFSTFVKPLSLKTENRLWITLFWQERFCFTSIIISWHFHFILLLLRVHRADY